MPRAGVFRGGRRARPGRDAGAARFAVLVLACALALVSCAKREPPSGGPPDLQPPFVLESMPDSGSAGVPRAVAPSITFSEGMNPRTTDPAISMAPSIPIVRRRWHGRTLTVSFADSLEAGRTYTLTVGNTAQDRHGNPMATGHAIVFTTGDSFPPGRIEGKIEGRGFSVGGAQLWVYEADRTGVPDSTARDYDAIGFADATGAFRVDGLAVPGRFRVWGFADLNRNRSFEPDADVLAPADTVIELTAARPLAANLSLTMINPRAPGQVKGTVVDSLGDTTAVLRIMARSRADTTHAQFGLVDDDGTFELDLQAGEWDLRAWADKDRNRRWDSAVEAASEPVTVTVEPASEVAGVELVLRPRPGSGP